MSENVPEFIITRRLAAPIERVFAAWAEPEQMVQWSGPPGAKVEIVEGEMAEGHSTISRSTSEQMPEMYTLALWREIAPHSRIAWEQSFCDEQGNKIMPPFFDAWPLTLLTTVDFAAKDGETEITLRWTPIEYSEKALAEFVRQMAGMKQGWGGSFDKLDAFLA